MANLSLAEAGDRLPELIDRALSGGGIVITCHGGPVVALKPVEQGPRPLTVADLDWIAAQRGAGPVPDEEAAATVRRLRDDQAV